MTSPIIMDMGRFSLSRLLIDLYKAPVMQAGQRIMIADKSDLPVMLSFLAYIPEHHDYAYNLIRCFYRAALSAMGMIPMAVNQYSVVGKINDPAGIKYLLYGFSTGFPVSFLAEILR